MQGHEDSSVLSQILREPSAEPIGVYCMANDPIAPWFRAFVASFRQRHPDVPLVVIPFDDRMDHIRALADEWNAVVLREDAPDIQELTELGCFHYRDNYIFQHYYRKFTVMINGPLSRFLFLDADIIVLESLTPLLALLENADLTAHNAVVSLTNDLSQVYRAGPFYDRMVQKHGSVGFNTGHFLSRKGLFTIEQVRALAMEVYPHLPDFLQTDQTFMNYCVDICYPRCIADAHVLIPNLGCTWAGCDAPDHTPAVRALKGLPENEADSVVAWIPFLHWAGYGLSMEMPYRDVFLHYSSFWDTSDFEAYLRTKPITTPPPLPAPAGFV